MKAISNRGKKVLLKKTDRQIIAILPFLPGSTFVRQAKNKGTHTWIPTQTDYQNLH